MIKPDTLLGPYTIGKQLGMGSFATVYLCKYKKEKYAVKVVSKQNKESHELLFKGHQILKAIHSIDNEFDEGKRHIVEFVDVVETDDYFGVVLELIPGIELFDYVMAHHRIVDEVALGLEEPIARNIMKQLLKGTLI
jgi:serine/threonine protein kinase